MERHMYSYVEIKIFAIFGSLQASFIHFPFREDHIKQNGLILQYFMLDDKMNNKIGRVQFLKAIQTFYERLSEDIKILYN